MNIYIYIYLFISRAEKLYIFIYACIVCLQIILYYACNCMHFTSCLLFCSCFLTFMLVTSMGTKSLMTSGGDDVAKEGGSAEDHELSPLGAAVP